MSLARSVQLRESFLSSLLLNFYSPLIGFETKNLTSVHQKAILLQCLKTPRIKQSCLVLKNDYTKYGKKGFSCPTCTLKKKMCMLWICSHGIHNGIVCMALLYVELRVPFILQSRLLSHIIIKLCCN